MTPYRLWLLDTAYRAGQALAAVISVVSGLCARITLALGEGPGGQAAASAVRYELSHLLLEAMAVRAERALSADPGAQTVTVRPWPWLQAIIPLPVEGPDEE